MRNYKVITVEQEELTDIICDKCGRVVLPDDVIEWQECFHTGFIGGYGSVFGDGNKVECDLCQNCLYELIDKFCYINGAKQK